jgi:hypothetical protein
MNRTVPVGLLTLISLVGVAYSGFLTYITYTTGVSGCERYFFGLPSCFYGFILYSMVFVFAFALLLVWRTVRAIVAVLLGVAGVGFSAFLTGYVLSQASCMSLSIFGVPPCAMGLAMFTIVFLIAASLFMKETPET